MAGAFFVERFRRAAEYRTVAKRELRDGAHGLAVWATALADASINQRALEKAE